MQMTAQDMERARQACADATMCGLGSRATRKRRVQTAVAWLAAAWRVPAFVARGTLGRPAPSRLVLTAASAMASARAALAHAWLDGLVSCATPILIHRRRVTQHVVQVAGV